MNLTKVNSNNVMANPLFIIIILLLGLIIVLAIFRSASPFLNLGFGINAHIGDLRGSFEIEAFDNENAGEKKQNDKLFVMYYAEWCGHCKRTMPEFQKLMDNYKGDIKIVAINSEDNENKELVKSQNIKGYPTIRYYPEGISDNYKEYENGRTYNDFVQYLNSM